MSKDQDKLVNQIRQRLDQQSEELDGETLSRLRQARARAVDAGGRKGFNLPGFGGGVVAFASVSVLAVAVWLAVPTDTIQEMPALAEAPVFDDMELLAATEELEFYEDIEFYYWLDTQDAQS